VRGNGIAYSASKSQHGGICQACENSGRPVLSMQDANVFFFRDRYSGIRVDVPNTRPLSGFFLKKSPP
jgi:hypothetical protein